MNTFILPQRRSLRKWKGERCPSAYYAGETLTRYGLVPVAELVPQFCISFTRMDAEHWTRSIYAFVINNEIVRIGSSKEMLRKRMTTWEKDVSRAMNGDNSGLTKEGEAELWAEELAEFGQGTIWAREGTKFETLISDTPISGYQDEESELIARHMPRLNRGKHR